MLQKKRLEQCENILADLVAEMEGGEVDQLDGETALMLAQCYLLINKIDDILTAEFDKRKKAELNERQFYKD